MRPRSVAIAANLEQRLRDHLIRVDGQEDVCFAIYAPSTGLSRDTAVLQKVLLPGEGERKVHGTASFTSTYLVRAINEAAKQGLGLAVLHSHPLAAGWQSMSGPDFETENEFGRIATEGTGLPLIGLTLSGQDGHWSAREWAADRGPVDAETVRVVGEKLSVFWCPTLRPTRAALPADSRTLAAWGDDVQRDLSNLRVLIVGLGSVGLPIAQKLAATGIGEIGLMDFDRVQKVNLDRMIGATRADALFRRRKVSVARRLARRARLSRAQRIVSHHMSITASDGVAIRTALDYDVIISCVDRHLPRAVLNTIAYADLIPVIDGGIAIDRFADGAMRNATWRIQTASPGRPCMSCSGQLSAHDVSRDLAGVSDDPGYVNATNGETGVNPNVAALSSSIVGTIMAHFVSLTAHPDGQGVPPPQQFTLPGATSIPVYARTSSGCVYEGLTAHGDGRLDWGSPKVSRRN